MVRFQISPDNYEQKLVIGLNMKSKICKSLATLAPRLLFHRVTWMPSCFYEIGVYFILCIN